VAAAEAALLRANDAFYAAFARGDAAAMALLWSARHPVACLHPGWPALFGRDDVLRSWAGILKNPPAIRHDAARALAYGGFGLVVCVERLGGARLAATNAFIRESEGWRMVHHQASPLGEGAGAEDNSHSATLH
jgi:hypothetical protein